MALWLRRNLLHSPRCEDQMARRPRQSRPNSLNADVIDKPMNPEVCILLPPITLGRRTNGMHTLMRVIGHMINGGERPMEVIHI